MFHFPHFSILYFEKSQANKEVERFLQWVSLFLHQHSSVFNVLSYSVDLSAYLPNYLSCINVSAEAFESKFQISWHLFLNIKFNLMKLLINSHFCIFNLILRYVSPKNKDILLYKNTNDILLYNNTLLLYNNSPIERVSS